MYSNVYFESFEIVIDWGLRFQILEIKQLIGEYRVRMLLLWEGKEKLYGSVKNLVTPHETLLKTSTTTSNWRPFSSSSFSLSEMGITLFESIEDCPASKESYLVFEINWKEKEKLDTAQKYFDYWMEDEKWKS